MFPDAVAERSFGEAGCNQGLKAKGDRRRRITAVLR